MIEPLGKKISRIFRIVLLTWSILFLVWMLNNFKALDQLVFFAYIPCFFKTTFRKANFMTMNSNDCKSMNENVVLFINS